MPVATYSVEQVEALEARIETLEESLHYCNGVADLAMKHRDEAEARVAVLTEALGESLDALEEYAIGIPGQLECEVRGREILTDPDERAEAIMAVLRAIESLDWSEIVKCLRRNRYHSRADVLQTIIMPFVGQNMPGGDKLPPADPDCPDCRGTGWEPFEGVTQHGCTRCYPSLDTREKTDAE